MKQRIFAILLSLTMMFTLAPAAWAEDATSGTSGGIDWKIEGDTLTISPSSSPERDFVSGQMVENFGTLTKKATYDADYIASLT